MNPDSHFDSANDAGRYEALLQMADLVVHHRGLPELLPELAQRLHEVAAFDVASFSLYDPDKNVMRMHFWEGDDRLPNLTELPIDESVCGLAWEKQQPMVWPDLHNETRFQSAVDLLKRKGIRSYCTLPLTTAEKRLGVLGLGSSLPNVYREADVRLLQRVAELVALALENVMTRAALLEEKERLGRLLEVSTTLMTNLDVRQLFPAISGLIRKVVRQDFASVSLYEEASQVMLIHALDSALAYELIGPDMVVPVAESVNREAFFKGELQFFNREDLAVPVSPVMQRLLDLGLQSFCCIPLVSRNGKLGTLNLGSLKENAFASEDISFLKQVAAQLAIALDNSRAYREIAELTDKLKKEKLYLQDEIRSVLNFEEIVGESPALKQVLSQVNTVAPMGRRRGSLGVAPLYALTRSPGAGHRRVINGKNGARTPFG